MLGNWPDEAGRAAYLAGLHAAQALNVESTGNTVKSHRGVQHVGAAPAGVTKDEPRYNKSFQF